MFLWLAVTSLLSFKHVYIPCTLLLSFQWCFSSNSDELLLFPLLLTFWTLHVLCTHVVPIFVTSWVCWIMLWFGAMLCTFCVHLVLPYSVLLLTFCLFFLLLSCCCCCCCCCCWIIGQSENYWISIAIHIWNPWIEAKSIDVLTITTFQHSSVSPNI